ncbi:PAS domain-containing sensor histidine kinase [Castellaniella caeni]|uniref:PAS domain-containing sensor histidine kinase n=1 Tax=Castellaniella caeni TaxID=266123 RepID=UPI000A06EFE9|nr:PAS domain-containing sensor histidine kinase [Castellaniella caeni]
MKPPTFASAAQLAQASLRRESARFSVLAQVSGMGVWEWDQERQHLWCSPEYFKMLGRDPAAFGSGERPNLTEVWASWLHPDDRERAVQAFADYLRLAPEGLYESAFRMRHSGGGWVWILSRGSTLRDADGRCTSQTVGAHINVTSLKEVQMRLHESEQRLQSLNASLEQRVQERTARLSTALSRLRHAQDELLQSEKLASLGALVAGVAHELNTPIGNAVTVASTLTQAHRDFRDQVARGLTRGALQHYLADVEEGGQIIERNLSRAAELIGGFKQLAVDQTSYQRRRFELHGVVREIILAMRPALRKTHCQVVDAVPEGLPLDSFPGPLGQVLMNLINNALVHAFEGQADKVITVTARAVGPAWLSVSVADNGCGMAPEIQKKIFDPFYTTRLGQGGSGLGLHIVYTLVTGLLGGRIEVQSAPAQGSCFTVLLPVYAQRADADAVGA